jgi:hypothetical protein
MFFFIEFGSGDISEGLTFVYAEKSMENLFSE